MPKARGRGVRTIGAVWALLAMTAVLLGAASPLAAAERLGTFESAKHRFHLVKVVDGLEHPWGLAFLSDGRMLVTERPGRLRIVADGWLVPEPVAGRARGVGRWPGRAARRGAAPRLRGERPDLPLLREPRRR